MFWGLSESLDLFKLLKENNVEHDDDEPSTVNILLINGCDARHIIKTLADEYQNPHIKFKFYVTEFSNDLIGRQILLLSLLMDFENLGASQKVYAFMELFGNSLIRPFTSKYLRQLSNQLIKDITDVNRNQMPFIDLQYLKFKDIDYLETLFKFWTGSGVFNICKLWDNRLRSFLGDRYDAKFELSDWDLSMELYDRGAKKISRQEYTHWRSNGVAFTWTECQFSKPNLTLASGIVCFGNSIMHCGYRGDIVTGPFIAYGLETSNENLLKTCNDTNMFRATDITENNLLKYFYQIQFKEPYIEKELDENHSYPGLLISELPQERLVDFQPFTVSSELSGSTNFKTIRPKNVNFEVIFLRYPVIELKQSQEFKNYFHLVYIPYGYLEKFSTELLSNILRPNSLIVVETEKYTLSNNMDQLRKQADKINEKFEILTNLYPLKYDYKLDTYAVFVYKQL